MTTEGEVEVVCLGDTAHIQDLGLRMVRGSRYTTTLSAAAKSRDLEMAKKQGIVGVKIMRAAIIRQESLPHVVDGSSQNQRTISRANLSAPSAPAPVPVPASDGNVAKALRELTNEVRKLREDIKAQGNPQDLGTAIALAVHEALRGVRFEGPGTGASVSVKDETPLFIPSGIVPTGSDPDIRTSTSVTGSVDEAGEALRKARGPRKES